MGYRLLLIGLFVVSVAYTLLARQIPMDPWTAEELVNAQTLPTVYGGLLSIVLMFLLFRGQEPGAGTPGMRVLRASGICALVLVFIAALAWVNLWVALGALLFGTSAWLGERRWPAVLALAIGVPLAGFVAIELTLGVYLPG